MEMKMLRWMSDITRLDHICTEDIRQRLGVAPITDKLREARLRWFGHVLRADSDSVCKVDFNLDVAGKRPNKCPKQRWMDTLHADQKAAGIHPEQAQDRTEWRQRIKRADLATKRGKRLRRRRRRQQGSFRNNLKNINNMRNPRYTVLCLNFNSFTVDFDWPGNGAIQRFESNNCNPVLSNRPALSIL
ncbi:hypothetical protein ANCDUO_02117 [Ancylostoma duodenale]|uniref:Uncharacterized protein n=1 Tax=Ancylostoma duodenale TaxID=51022 RepID=A0A0C2H1C5_9BILA|nr:hypothetical protein ANCDUO_02117 [Ancylostoma duodenale]